MKKIFSVIAVAFLLFTTMAMLLTDLAESEVQTGFKGGPTETITFDLAGEDSSTSVTMDTGKIPHEVSMNISNGKYNNAYPLNPVIDLAGDGDIDWTFNDTGYGSFGHQTLFSDDSTEHQFEIDNVVSAASFLIPKNAEVTSASMKVNGHYDSNHQKHELTPEGIDNAWALESGDINGDGYDDVVIGENTETGQLMWLENPKYVHGTWTHQVIADLPYIYHYQVIDMDSDADLDVVVSNRLGSQGVRWYNNTAGDGSTWTEENINDTFPEGGHFELADVDNDGDDDVVIIGDHHSTLASIAWIERPPHLNQNWTTHMINTTITYPHRLAVFDFDGDTNKDIALVSDHWDTDIEGLYLFKCPADPKTEVWTGKKIAYIDSAWEMLIEDVDADTHADIMICNSSASEITWYESPDAPFSGTWTAQTLLSGFSGPRSIKFCDVDGDMDDDIIGIEAWGDSVFWIENPSVVKHTIPCKVHEPRYITALNMDDANETDFAVFGGDMSEVIGLNESAGTYEQSMIQDISPGVIFRQTTGNFDGVNHDDVAFISNSGEYLAVRLSGPNVDSPMDFTIIDDTLLLPHGLNTTDLDGDGDLDLVVSVYSGADIFWYENKYDTTPLTPWEKHTIVLNGGRNYRDLKTANIDGKNGTDLFVYERATDGSVHVNNQLVWYEAPADPTDGGQVWHRHMIANSLIGVHQFDVGDIDQDGYVDIVFTQLWNDGSWHGNISWAKHPLGYTNVNLPWSVRSVDDTMVYPYDVQVCCVNGDDRPDIIATDYSDDKVLWYLTPDDLSTGTFTEYSIDPNINQAMYFDCTDLGNDGVLEIVVSDYTEDHVLLYREPENVLTPGAWDRTVLDASMMWSYDVEWGDLSGDGFKDIVVSGTYPGRMDVIDMIPNYPPSAELDIGWDSVIDWSETTPVDREMTTSDLSTAINDYLDTALSFKDPYGNEMVNVPFVIEGPEGEITAYDLNIEYSVTQFIKGTGLAEDLKDHIVANNGSGTTDVPITITSQSPGSIILSDLSITLNEPPEQLLDIPSNLSIDEDTKNDQLLDLRDYFDDDWTLDSKIVYGIKSYTNHYHVKVSIKNTHFLSADASLTEHWNGKTTVVVYAQDDDGVKTETPAFDIVVSPVQDPPELGPDDFEKAVFNEGETYGVDLFEKEYFTDPDGDPLYIDTNLNTKPIPIQNNLTIDYNRYTGILNFTAKEGYSVKDLSITIYCDDETPVVRSLSKNILIDVVNLVQPMSWDPLPIVKVNEDSTNPDEIDLSKYVSDPDHPTSTIVFKVQSYDNSSYIDLNLASSGMLSVSPHSHFYGESIVNILAENQYDSAAAKLFIVVDPVNDPPELSDLKPDDGETILKDSVQLSWTGNDIEGEKIQYKLFLDTKDGSTFFADISSNRYTLSNLTDNTTYYWKVQATDGTHSVDSNVQTFKIDLAAAEEYELKVTVSSWVEIEPGNSDKIYIRIENPTSVQNYVVIWLKYVSPDISTFLFFPEENEKIYVDPSSTKEVVVIVNLNKFEEEGDYSLTLSVQNGLTKDIQEHDVTVRVKEESDPSSINVSMIIIPLVILLMVIIIIVAFVMIRRRKGSEGDEPEAEKEEEPEPAKPTYSQPMDEPEEEEKPDPVKEEVHLRSDIEEDLNRLLSKTGPHLTPDGALEPEIGDSSIFDEEAPPGIGDEEDMPVLDIDALGEDPVVEQVEEPELTGFEADPVIEEPIVDTTSKVSTPKGSRERYNYTYSKRDKKKKKSDEELVELTPLEDEPKRSGSSRPARSSKEASKKKGKGRYDLKKKKGSKE